MDEYLKSPRSAESAFQRSIQPVNINKKLRPRTSNTNTTENMHYDGTLSILKLIGFRTLFVAFTRETVQYFSQQVINIHQLIQHAYAKALPYKNIFLRWVSRVYFDFRRKAINYEGNHANTKDTGDMATCDDDYYEDDEYFDDYDSQSVFSNADTDISSPTHGKSANSSKVAELENEVLRLKQQLSIVLEKMNIKIPEDVTQTPPLNSSLLPLVVGSSVPPPPPLPTNLFKSSEAVVNRPKAVVVAESCADPPAVPRITEILGDLSKVQLRHVPRSPGGTPFRSRVISSGDTMADAVKNAMDKRRKDLDTSLDENGLDDSWEEEKEN